MHKNAKMSTRKVNTYCILDVETTGLSRQNDRVVQIACLKINENGEKSPWMSYINPCTDREKQLHGGYKVHHIPPDMLLKKPKFKNIVESLLTFLADVDCIVAFNCLYDWDMMCREFRLLDQAEIAKPCPQTDQSEGTIEISKTWTDRFNERHKWVDALRLAILHYPTLPNHKLGSVAKHLNIKAQSSTSYSYQHSLKPGEWEGFSVAEQGMAQWKDNAHDAMCDVLTTYELMKQCMNNNGITKSFEELISEFPQTVLDTGLFLTMERLLEGKRVTNNDLLPFSARAKKYFSTYRPKGKMLGRLSKGFLYGCTESLKSENGDGRIILIYEAAFLEPTDFSTDTNGKKQKREKQHFSSSTDFKNSKSSDLSNIFRQKKPRLGN